MYHHYDLPLILKDYNNYSKFRLKCDTINKNHKYSFIYSILNNILLEPHSKSLADFASLESIQLLWF